MQLRYKTLVIISVTIIGMMLLMYATSQVILIKSYTDLERQDVTSEVESAVRELNYDLQTLDMSVTDFSNWDDTYNFTLTRDPAYVNANLVNVTFVSQRLNFIVIEDASGKVIASRCIDLKTLADLPAPAGLTGPLEDGQQRPLTPGESSTHGIIVLSDQPALVSASPIRRSDGTGPSRGTVIMGRYLNGDEIGLLKNITGIPLNFDAFIATGPRASPDLLQSLAAGDSGVIVLPRDSDVVSGYTIIHDISGKPALILHVDLPRTIYRQGQTSNMYIVLAILLSGLVFSAVILSYFMLIMVPRMLKLGETVVRISRDRDFTARVPVKGDDELTEFAVQVNRMLDVLESSQQRIKESEEKFRGMVENISDMVWEMDAGRRFTYVSPQSREVMGYEPGDLLGKDPFTLMREGDGERLILAIREQIARGEIPVLVQVEIPRPDGRLTCLEASGMPFWGPDGKIVGYRGIARDIGERKRAEETLRESGERLRLCAATARLGTFDWDLDRDRHVWSQETYEIYGLPPDTPLTQDLLMGLIYPGDRKDETLAAALDPAGPGGYTMEYRITRASDGAIRWVFVRARVFFSGEGTGRRAVRVLGAIQDITDRKRAEETMTASLCEKEVLLKEIHHRVKNNLQIISSLLSLQSENIGSGAPAETFRESQDRIRSMALIHEKLYQSKDLSRIDFAEYVRSLTAYLSHSYVTGQGVGIAVDIEDLSLGIDTAIPCGLIINELVSNALKYAFPPGRPGEIRVSLARTDDRYRLTVSDNGVGLPPGFDFRNTSSLGLQLVSTLVGQLEGTIELESSCGTRFRITFAELKPGASRFAAP